MKQAFQGQITGEGYGFVYVMSYPGSDKVKIGHTLNPVARATEIGGTMAPETPVIEAFFWCSERREAVERAAHRIEQENRSSGEWFTIPVHRAVSTIRRAAEQAGVIVQLVYDRNQFEARAAAEQATEQAARIAALRSAVETEWNKRTYRPPDLQQSQAQLEVRRREAEYHVGFTDWDEFQAQLEVRRCEAPLEKERERIRDEVDRHKKFYHMGALPLAWICGGFLANAMNPSGGWIYILFMVVILGIPLWKLLTWTVDGVFEWRNRKATAHLTDQ